MAYINSSEKEEKLCVLAVRICSVVEQIPERTTGNNCMPQWAKGSLWRQRIAGNIQVVAPAPERQCVTAAVLLKKDEWHYYGA